MTFWTDGCPTTYKNQFAVAGLEWLRQTCGLASVTHCFTEQGCFKGQHNGEGKIGQQFVQAAIRSETITATTVWEVFLHLQTMPVIPVKTAAELAVAAPHRITERIQVFMCDESIATEEQRARAASHGDVLIVDVQTDWNGLPIPDHKKKFCFRAEQNGEDPQAAGRVCTRFMFCSCASCDREDWDRCLLIAEVGPWTVQSNAFTATRAREVGENLVQDLPALLAKIIAGKLTVEYLKSLLKVFGVKPGKANKPVLVVLALEKLVQRSVLGAEAALESAKAAAATAAADSVARQGAGRGRGRGGGREGGRAGGSRAPAEGGGGGGRVHVWRGPFQNPAADTVGGEGDGGEDEEGGEEDDDDVEGNPEIF